MIMIANVDSEINKEVLIQKLKKLFPGKFDSLTSKDFHFDTGHRYTEDNEDTIRYHLSFHKEYAGKQVYGGVEFVGENLDLQSFYYSPSDVKDALFPAKVTEKEALEIAVKFIKSHYSNDSYRLNDNHPIYNQVPTNLTEPVRYQFAFEQLKNDVPVMGQNMNITVLGNGEIVEFNSGEHQKKNVTYEEKSNFVKAETALQQIKDNFDVTLQYMVDYDYRNEETQVELVYGVERPIDAMHAKSRKWLIGQEFTDKLPDSSKIKMLSDAPIKEGAKPITDKEAKAIAEKLLRPGNDDIKLIIESVSEQENKLLGKTVYSVQYMYQSRNSGHGTSIEIDKNTGEVVSFYDISEDVFGKTKDAGKTGKITYSQAVERAIAFIKKYSPSIMHEYSYPTHGELKQSRQGEFYLSFPKVKNGIQVIGDSINITIKSDGSMSHYNVQSPNIKEWPSAEKVVSREKALHDYLDQLKVKMAYTKTAPEKNHYSLVYFWEFENQFHYYDAITGEWKKSSEYQGQNGTEVKVSHPTAEKELNHLIQAGIIKVTDPDTFNADLPLTKGEALEVLMRSIMHYYEFERTEHQEKPTFSNITKDHPLYSIVELAAQQKIIDTTQETFSADETITNEELAFWYIRALDLDLAAKHSDIYTLPFKDAAQVQKRYIGYVALANKLGLFPIKDNTFSPAHQVTLADIALSNVRLARKMEVSNK